MIPKQLTIDLNADLGEYQTENQYFLECQILNHISTCNIACGGHTGNEESMKKTSKIILSLVVLPFC